MECNVCGYDERYCSTVKAIADDLPEVECQNCWWQGNSSDLSEDMLCPECGSDDICDYED